MDDKEPQALPNHRHNGGWVKRFLPRTLLWRSFLILLVPLVLLQVAATWFFYDRHYDTITRRLAQWTAGSIATYSAMLERDPSRGSLPFLIQTAARTQLMEIQFLPGASLPTVSDRQVITLLDRHLFNALTERLGRPFVMDTRRLPEHVEIQVDLTNGVLLARVRKEHLFSDTTYIFVIWMVGSSVVLFAISMIFMRNQVRPIRRLARAADSFGRGLEVTGFKPEGATEVRQAAQAFLQMRARIKRQIQQRTEMLAGVSHDLRTPLTRMKLELALMPKTPELEALAADLAEMEHMVEGYLAFARGEGTEVPRDTDLAALLAEIVDQLARSGHQVVLTAPESLPMTLRPATMRRCLTNLLENALRHGQRVEALLRLEANRIELLIDDDGPGIPPDHRETVFKPFFRLDQARGPDRGGSGLGLTIARDAARSHGGDILLEDSPLGGLRVRLRLPR